MLSIRQFDEAEYLMVKSLAYDAPVSLQTSFGSMKRHPLTPQVLQIVKVYGQLRLSGPVPARLRVTDFLGEPVRVAASAGRVTLPVGSRRTTLLFDAMSADAARAVVAKATFRQR